MNFEMKAKESNMKIVSLPVKDTQTGWTLKLIFLFQPS